MWCFFVICKSPHIDFLFCTVRLVNSLSLNFFICFTFIFFDWVLYPMQRAGTRDCQGFIPETGSGGGHMLLQAPIGVAIYNKIFWTNTSVHRPTGEETEVLESAGNDSVATAIFYGVMCWCSSITTADRRRQDELARNGFGDAPRNSAGGGRKEDGSQAMMLAGEWLPPSV